MVMDTDEKAVPLLILDLDGTVREGKDDELGKFVNGPEDVRVFPQALKMMYAWKKAGGRIIGVTNQGGVALGHLTYANAVAAVHETQRQCGYLFDKIGMCTHHPFAVDPEFARCWCRKPAIGMLVANACELAKERGEIYPAYMALMVGDRPEDEACARAASIDFQWAAEWRAAVDLLP